MGALLLRDGHFVWLLVAVLMAAKEISAQNVLKRRNEDCREDAECLEYMVCGAGTNNTKTCVCIDGYTARSTDQCARQEGSGCVQSSQCGTSLKCTDNLCTCPSNYISKHDHSCGLLIGGACTSTSQCGDRMTCHDETCACDVTYNVTLLKTCETPCNTSECQPGGQCFIAGYPPSQTCYCHPGYTGSKCEVPIVEYTIRMSTGVSDHANTHNDVDLVVTGTRRSTGRLVLTTYFSKGSTRSFTREGADVGQILQITFSTHMSLSSSVDRWFLKDIFLQKGSSTSVPQIYTFVVRSWTFREQFYNLSNPCVTSSCETTNTSCEHVGLTSHNYTCTCNGASQLPLCATDAECEYHDTRYHTAGTTVPEFQCPHTLHCRTPATAAIMTSVQELDNVTQCVCQRDVSGFFVRLKVERETLTTAAPTDCRNSNTDKWCQARPSWCFTSESSSRIRCGLTCGYCTGGWQELSGAHRYRRVSGGDYNVSLAGCEARCQDYELVLHEVGCFGANRYQKPVLCQSGADDDNSGLLRCPETPSSTAFTLITDDTTTTVATTATTTTTTTTTEPETTTEIVTTTPSSTTTPSPPTTPTPTPTTTLTCSSSSSSSSNATLVTPPPGMTMEAFQQQLVAELRRQLLLDASTLSATRARKTSATDPRPSCQAAGWVAVTFLLGVGVLLLLADLTRVCRHYWDREDDQDREDVEERQGH